MITITYYDHSIYIFGSSPTSSSILVTRYNNLKAQFDITWMIYALLNIRDIVHTLNSIGSITSKELKIIAKFVR